MTSYPCCASAYAFKFRWRLSARAVAYNADLSLLCCLFIVFLRLVLMHQVLRLAVCVCVCERVCCSLIDDFSKCCVGIFSWLYFAVPVDVLYYRYYALAVNGGSLLNFQEFISDATYLHAPAAAVNVCYMRSIRFIDCIRCMPVLHTTCASDD